MESVITSIFFFVLSFGVLITFHEFGHFWVARKLGVKVLRFSVGYGKPIWAKKMGPDQTEYVIAALPLGGYVKMLDERESEVDSAELHRAFNRQKLSHRTAIVAAGPIFNFLLAIVAYWAIFMLGITGVKPLVGEVLPDSVAQVAGFAVGDEIVSVGETPTPTWNAAVLALIEESLASRDVEVQVVTAHGAKLSRFVDLSHLAAELEQGNVLDSVGIVPMRMRIPAVLGRIEPGSPSERAGLSTGDTLLMADGVVVEHWSDWVELVRSKPGKAINVVFLRDNVERMTTLTPAPIQGEDGVIFGRIGAGVQYDPEQGNAFIVKQQFGFFESLYKAIEKTWDVSILTLKMLYNMIFGDISFKNLSGPISIAQYAGDSASIGIVAFLTFMAVVSISLGVLNLLPIPILDGGHLMFYLVEFVKGSPVTLETELKAQQVGIVILLVTMTFAFYNDLARIFN